MGKGNGMTYKGAGVDYGTMDEFKKKAQVEAAKTKLKRSEFKVVEKSRGESAFLIETSSCYLAHVEEGLGTKNLVADEMYALTGKSYYYQIAQDGFAMIVNDLVTSGAMPLSVGMHLAVGDSAWFKDKLRYEDLLTGWRNACIKSKCAYGPGETPTLRKNVYPKTFVLSGSAIGVVQPKDRLIDPNNIRVGDSIVFIKSSGIHANGLTLARKIANKLPDGFLTEMKDGRTYGDALLDPTIIYSPLVDECFREDIYINYAVNITGHGWRKLMRAEEPFQYVIKNIFDPQPIFKFIQEQGKIKTKEMYENFNMGVGFALFVNPDYTSSILEIAKDLGLEAIEAGYVDLALGKDKKVIIKPKNIVLKGYSAR